jgi:hypothetical protein
MSAVWGKSGNRSRAAKPTRLTHLRHGGQEVVGVVTPRSSKLFPRDQLAVLTGYEHRKIMTVDVERDAEVGGMQMRLGPIVERVLPDDVAGSTPPSI